MNQRDLGDQWTEQKKQQIASRHHRDPSGKDIPLAEGPVQPIPDDRVCDPTGDHRNQQVGRLHDQPGGAQLVLGENVGVKRHHKKGQQF